MPRVRVPGVDQPFVFPDGMAPEEMQAAIEAHLARQAASAEPPPPHQPTQIDAEKFTAPPATGNVPAGFLTGDPAQDRQISQNLRESGASPQDLTRSDVAHAAGIAGGAVLGLAPGLPAAGLSGAVQALGMSKDPSLKDALYGGVGGLAAHKAVEAAGGLVKSALPFARRAAVKIFNPGGDTSAIREAYTTPTQVGERALEAAGQSVLDTGAAAPGMSLYQRGALLSAHGEQAGREIHDVLQRAHDAGDRVNGNAVIEQLKGLRDKYFGGPWQDLTPDMRESAKVADEYIARLEAKYRPQVTAIAKPVEGAAANQGGTSAVSEPPTPSTVNGEVVPLEQRGPKVAVSSSAQGDVSLAQSQMDQGATAATRADRAAWDVSQRLRAYMRTHPDYTMTAEGRALLKEWDEASAAAGKTAQGAEDAQASFDRIKNVSPNGTFRDQELRRGRLYQDTTRPQPDSGWHPIVDEMDLLTSEEAKKILQGEGYITASGKQLDARAAAVHPEIQFLREASGVIRNANEQAISNPNLRRVFQAAKADSGTAQTFAPVAMRAGDAAFAGGNGAPHGFSLRSAAVHSALDRSVAPFRPRLVQAAQEFSQMGSNDPYAKPSLAAALAALREEAFGRKGSP